MATTEGMRIAPFVSQEGRFLEAVRRATQELGNPFFVQTMDGSVPAGPAVYIAVRKDGPVEYLTAKEVTEEGGEKLLIDVERQADSYIVYSHESADWERPFRRKKKAEKPVQEQNPI